MKISPRRFIFLCTAVYFTSYLTRVNYGAIITELIAATAITRAEAGSVSTALFFTYGLGQLISGFIGDRVSPRRLIVIGMSVTALCNLAMPLFPVPAVMTALWAANGFAQALFWPPLVRMMATHLSPDDYTRACVSVSAGSAAATIVIYLLAPLCILIGGWRPVFYVGAAGAVAMTVLWLIAAPRDDDDPAQSPIQNASKPAPAHSLRHDRATVGMLAWLALAIVLQGILRDGVTTWMPTLVADTFDLPATVSILSGIVLPIFSMISYSASTKLATRVGNIVATSAILFAIGALAAGLLALLLGAGPVPAVLLTALVTACMHGVNLMLITRIPAYFGPYGCISTVSGILNAFTYVGSAASTYGFAVLSAKMGWSFTVLAWCIIAAAGAAVCAVGALMWRRFIARRPSVY